jgi:mevalonate kinase
MNKSFSTRTYGKWILAGEHAVLRGSPALAFPLIGRSLQLGYEPHSKALDVQFRGEHGTDYKLLFYGVIENALSQLKISQPLTGTFTVDSSLPVGTGLGASAALCGAVARWCEGQGWVAPGELYEFARRLEDLFHGESSGVDLAVSLGGRGVRFVRNGEQKVIQNVWSPKLYLSYCGQRGMTSECVAKVKQLFESDRALAQKLDKQMHLAVDLAEKALINKESVGTAAIKESLELALACFEQWGLCKGDLAHHIRHLKESGALAAKPTGSGGGGYVLSLWSDSPPVSLQSLLVSAFP